jgi:hypothetical protein
MWTVEMSDGRITAAVETAVPGVVGRVVGRTTELQCHRDFRWIASGSCEEIY